METPHTLRKERKKTVKVTQNKIRLPKASSNAIKAGAKAKKPKQKSMPP